MDPVQNTQAASLSSFIWETANELWGDFKHTDFARIIIPLLLLRRMECVLEPTKEDVLEAYESEKGSGIDLSIYLPNISKLPFYNTSQYAMGTVGSTHTRSNLEQYVSHFSPNVRLVFEEFGFNNTVEELDKAKLLYRMVSRFSNIDLHPDVVSNRVLSNAYEDLIAYSRPRLPLIPDEACHPFHAKAATDSTAKLPPRQTA